MLENYRRVLAVPGGLRFSSTGLVARLPMAMYGLGIVLLVSAVTGSYGLAGSVSATYLVANAVSAVLVGRLIDRLGQARVLTAAVLVCSLGMGLVMVSAWWRWPLGATYAAAVLAGLTFPPIGSCIRARWSHVLTEPGQVQTAYALEGVVDEAVFILGPIVVTVLATSVHPLAGLGVAVAAGAAGTLALAAQGGTAPPAGAHHDTGRTAARMPWRTIAPLTAICTLLGAFFGSAEVAAVAFADAQGDKGAAGFLLALWAFGSLAAGVVTGAVSWRRGPAGRIRIGTVALTVVMTPLAFIGSMPLMGVALFVAGFGVAPTLIATLTLTENVVPAARLTEGMGIVHTGIVAGVAPGATLAGLVIDAADASSVLGSTSPAFLVTVSAAVLAGLAAQTLPR
jgi:MFS family permease